MATPHTPTSAPTLAWPLALLAVFVVGAAALLILLGGDQGNKTPPFEPRRAELPGGFDPVPHFGDTAHELVFRGAACVEEERGRYRLYRQCQG